MRGAYIVIWLLGSALTGCAVARVEEPMRENVVLSFQVERGIWTVCEAPCMTPTKKTLANSPSIPRAIPQPAAALPSADRSHGAAMAPAGDSMEAARHGAPELLDSAPAEPAKTTTNGGENNTVSTPTPARPNLVIHYDTNSSYPHPHSREQLAQSIGVIGNNTSIEVHGHSDAIGAKEYNDWISRQRARRIRDMLLALGAQPAQVSIVAHGDCCPIGDNATPAGRASNRRVELIVGVKEPQVADAMRAQ